MAPCQYPRQVLIWSLPTLAVLISLFWYKRRRTSLRSDPGGTRQAKTSEPVDTNTGSASGKSTAVDTDKVISAIEKALRDRQTSQPIQEVVAVEEEGAEEHSGSAIKETEEEGTSSLNKFNRNLEKDIKVAVLLAVLKEAKADCSSKEKEDTTIGLEIINKTDNIKTEQNCSIGKIEEDIVEDNIQVKKVDDNIVEAAEERESPMKDDSSLKLDNRSSKIEISPVDETLTDSKSTVNSSKRVEESIVDLTVFDDNNIKETPITDELNCENCNKSDVKGKKLKKSKSGKETKLAESKVKEEKEEEETKTIGLSDKAESMALECNRVVVEENEQRTSAIGDAEVHLEQKLASLGLDTARNQEGGERDSANHSPAEVMLASPSMSNFSDAHSEGSSDSGKGCSDVATPPPQTPAGGSSVAGDLIASVYEFIIPQYMVGRLIGRHGAFLHEIRGKTNTNIFIKRHPDTQKLKICAIEGAQQDVDGALAMIRQKFPARRFPTLTLEKVSFVNVEPMAAFCPLQSDSYQLQLIEGVNNDVILSSLITAGHFFLQQPTHPSYQSLRRLNLIMNSTYSSLDAPPLDVPIKDAVCAAPTMGGWYRAQISSINDDDKTVDVRFLDYGGYLTLDVAALRKIRADFMMLPFQAVECLLASIIPAGEEAEWSEEAREFVQTITCGQMLQAQVYDYTEEGIPLVFLYASCGAQVVLVNQELVASGYADMVTPPTPPAEEE